MRVLRSFYGAARFYTLAVLLLLVGAPISLMAVQQNLRVVSDHSTASLFLGSAADPTAFNLGITRVSGDVRIDPNTMSVSGVNLTLYAANTNEDVYSNYPTINFRSQDVRRRSDGKLEAHGRLTVTQVSREEVASTGEDFSGFAYGPPTLSRTGQKATFIFADPRESAQATSGVNAYVVSTQLSRKKSDTPFTGSATINGAGFPELSRAIENVPWPLPVDNERCSEPLTVGEDYDGSSCTGKIDELSTRPELLITPAEDFAGIQEVKPVGNQVTIQLSLELAGGDSHSVGR